MLKVVITAGWSHSYVRIWINQSEMKWDKYHQRWEAPSNAHFIDRDRSCFDVSRLDGKQLPAHQSMEAIGAILVPAEGSIESLQATVSLRGVQ